MPKIPILYYMHDNMLPFGNVICVTHSICANALDMPCGSICLAARYVPSGRNEYYTLKRNSTISPSFITYSFPSNRTRPFSLAPA